ncbi:hypothetical protein GEO21_13750 [Sphingobacterium faecium]|uniref:DUF4595 domain-containing protein n=1 Tax=Sphingobacterium faecium TaxID=34087 RepID=UPI0012910C3C|nr:DUF4595 domain-containing protein [Sphingobacterium faecium]MQP28571.1 hypothetical protein [Sphingobacterium faecium]
MKKVILLLMTVATFVGCSKKDNTDNNSGEIENNCLVEQLTYEGGFVKFKRDNQNRVINAQNELDERPWQGKLEHSSYDFDYDVNTIKLKFKNEYESYTIIYQIDKSNNVVKSQKLDSYNSVDIEKDYSYDTNGYLNKIISKSKSKWHRDIILEYKNGNLVETNENYGSENGILNKSNFEFKYDLSQNDVPYSALYSRLSSTFDFSESVLLEQGYFGKKSKNVISSEKSLYSDGAPHEINWSFTYTTNNNGLITNVKEVEETDGAKEYTIDYKCK